MSSATSGLRNQYYRFQSDHRPDWLPCSHAFQLRLLRLYAVFAFQAYGIVTAEGLAGDALKAAQAEAYTKPTGAL